MALVFGGRGGLFFFLRGGRAPLEESGADSESDSSSDSKRFLLRLCLGFGLGLVLDAGGEGLVGWGGGGGGGLAAWGLGVVGSGDLNFNQKCKIKRTKFKRSGTKINAPRNGHKPEGSRPI